MFIVAAITVLCTAGLVHVRFLVAPARNAGLIELVIGRVCGSVTGKPR